MKILIIMAGFFPGKKYGGPPVSVDNFCTLMQDLECYIVTKNHDKGNLKPYEGVSNGWNERNNCKVMYLSDDKYNKSNFEVLLKEINPDILYLQGLFQTCVFPCLQLAKEHSIRVLLAPRGELCAGALNIRKWKKIPYIFLIKLMGLVNDVHWQSTSEEETTAIKKLIGVKEDHIHRLDNIPTIPQRDYPRKEKKAGEGRFVFLSRIHPKKNLLFAISLFKERDLLSRNLLPIRKAILDPPMKNTSSMAVIMNMLLGEIDRIKKIYMNNKPLDTAEAMITVKNSYILAYFHRL